MINERNFYWFKGDGDWTDGTEYWASEPPRKVGWFARLWSAMKCLVPVLVLLTFLILPASAADRYWVGGTGNWSDNTNHWSATDGGAPGASLPTSADNVFFTAASSGAAYAVTADTTVNCLDMTWALPGAGVPTFQGTSQNINIYGSMTLVVGMLHTFTGSTTNFVSTSTGKTITTAGVTPSTGFTFNGSGGGWTLADTLTLSSARTITVTNGTLNTNAQTVTAGFFVSTSGTRTLTLDGSTINITGTSGSPLSVQALGTLTYTTTGTTFNLNGGAAGVSLSAIFPASLNSGTVNITGAGVWTVSGTFVTFANFNYTSTTNKTDSLSFASNYTIAVNGLLTFAGNSVVNRAFVKSSTLGTARTFTISGTTVPSLTNVDFQDITASGNTPWTGTSLGDCLGNSGITFDASTTQTLSYVSGSNIWSNSVSWTSRVPLPQDDVVVGTIPGSSALVVDMPRLGRNINASTLTATGTLSFSSTPNTAFGNITLPATASSVSGTSVLTLAGRGSHTITNNGKTFPQAVTVAAFGGTYTLQDAFVSAGTTVLTDGTFNDGGFNFTSSGFTSSVSTTRAIVGAGTWDLNGVGTVSRWNVSSTFGISFASTWSIKFSGLIGGATVITFAGAGKTYNNFWWSNTGSTGTLVVTGANTFADFKIDGTTARTVTFPSSTTTTMSSFTRSNQGTAVLTIGSSTPGSAHTLSKASGTVSLDYLAITDSTATGGATWNACNSTSGGGNSGWNIYAGACPSGNAGRLMMMGVGN